MRLEDIPGIVGRKKVHAFVKDHLAMLFEDVRRIIVQRGCNFACANLLCDLISGLSVTVYKPTGTTGGAGKIFKALLKSPFFPWEPADSAKDKEQKAKVLYEFIRIFRGKVRTPSFSALSPAAALGYPAGRVPPG
jgi:hypothetical protein